jgi:uncharacterized protein YcgL (UPF0745 family)
MPIKRDFFAQVPEALLQPQGMPQAVTSPVWTSLAAPVGK